MSVFLNCFSCQGIICSSYEWQIDVNEIFIEICFFQDSPEVHVNAAETLCAITRFAPSGLAAKISSPR